MQESYIDLRIARTKSAIRDALTKLIEEKGFESLTVKDITTRAGINRGTFYLHYRDKYDLLKKCQKEIMDDISKIVQKGFLRDIVSKNSATIPFHFSVSIFEYLDKHGDFMKALLGPKGDLSFHNMWKSVFENNLNNFIKRENLLVPEEYLISYIASAHLGVIQQWLHNGRKESPKEMAKILSSINLNGPIVAAGLKND
ncbi:AcrR family transcriptional regulator [Scopulibacillus daqui]|uniref:AcrR family transcriptional regulator n=1 Tax=Scopulibacillus daqui TaxID=1469162 RepID=A0ABS2Q0U0_9BACL|nr:TetR/AcrR family transcriptional regulator [Scopulibacillus daqui]MBM7645916.1 AcrR family transcriptional regulator [Scopulibacillus daqui]